MFKESNTPEAQDFSGGGSARILVVDDDALQGRLLQHILTNAGYEVALVREGQAALDSVAKNPPDLLVLDFDLPDMSGEEVCMRIRKDPACGINELPVLMLTAHATEADEIACWDAGANDFVSKPVSRSVLVARIKTQLKLHALSTELRAQNEELSRWRDEREADLEAARATQEVILPTEVPDMPGWKISTIYAPVIQVGGDIFGWRPGADGSWLFWLADATGHGASAALFTTLAALLFNSGSQNPDSPAALLERVNARFYSVFAGHSIMSACCLVVHPDGTVRFANAGHPPLLIRRKDGRVESIEERETMLGIHKHLSFADAETTIAPGESALLYTDGLYSFLDQKGNRMEQSAVPVAFAGSTGEDGQLLGSIVRHIKAVSDGNPSLDDVAAILIDRP